MPVGGDAEWLGADRIDELPEELAGGILVAALTEHRVDEGAIPVDGPVQVAPTPGDLHVRLVDVPGLPGTAAPPGAELVGEQRREAELPASDRLVRDLESALEQQLGDVAEAELVAQAPQHGERHDVGRMLEIVEWRPRPLVEDTPAARHANVRYPRDVRRLRRPVCFDPQRGEFRSAPLLHRW